MISGADGASSHDGGTARWTIPANQTLVVGRDGGPADIGIAGPRIADEQASLRWTGSRVEIRAINKDERP